MSSFRDIIRREFRLGDLMVVLLALVAIVVSVIWVAKPRENLRVFIYKDNQLWGDYALDKDREITIDAHNRIAIENGKVAITYSDCADKRCVKQGFSNSLPIICMPNRLMLEIGTPESHHKLILQ
ncbi:MAG: NusG domain II-containing protein [Candidatus Cloacimonetes bacterium]|nr:NusG domain II-containing protein [Candidatus Cloacimonadota bacterium]